MCVIGAEAELLQSYETELLSNRAPTGTYLFKVLGRMLIMCIVCMNIGFYKSGKSKMLALLFQLPSTFCLSTVVFEWTLVWVESY